MSSLWLGALQFTEKTLVCESLTRSPESKSLWMVWPKRRRREPRTQVNGKPCVPLRQPKEWEGVHQCLWVCCRRQKFIFYKKINTWGTVYTVFKTRSSGVFLPLQKALRLVDRSILTLTVGHIVVTECLSTLGLGPTMVFRVNRVVLLVKTPQFFRLKRP